MRGSPPLSHSLRQGVDFDLKSQRMQVGSPRLAVSKRREPVHHTLRATDKLTTKASYQSTASRSRLHALASSSRSRPIPERILVFTVPSGCWSCVASSCWLNPWKYAITRRQRCCSGSWASASRKRRADCCWIEATSGFVPPDKVASGTSSRSC